MCRAAAVPFLTALLLYGTALSRGATEDEAEDLPQTIFASAQARVESEEQDCWTLVRRWDRVWEYVEIEAARHHGKSHPFAGSTRDEHLLNDSVSVSSRRCSSRASRMAHSRWSRSAPQVGSSAVMHQSTTLRAAQPGQTAELRPVARRNGIAGPDCRPLGAGDVPRHRELPS